MNIRTGVNLDKEMKKLMKFSHIRPYNETHQEHLITAKNSHSNSFSEDVKYMLPVGIAIFTSAALIGYRLGKISR